jgi:hypothetical protein
MGILIRSHRPRHRYAQFLRLSPESLVDCILGLAVPQLQYLASVVAFIVFCQICNIIASHASQRQFQREESHLGGSRCGR